MNCKFCNEEFKARASNHKYCSASCRQKAFYYNNQEEMKAKRLSDNSAVPTRIHYRVKSRAKSKGIPFNIDVEDIIVPEMCPVLGISIHYAPGEGTNKPNSPSLDRIDPDKGYTKGNVRIISNRANLLKSNATIEELEAVLKDLKCLRH